jgi:hypothetical protein
MTFHVNEVVENEMLSLYLRFWRRRVPCVDRNLKSDEVKRCAPCRPPQHAGTNPALAAPPPATLFDPRAPVSSAHGRFLGPVESQLTDDLFTIRHPDTRVSRDCHKTGYKHLGPRAPGNSARMVGANWR